MEVQSTLKYSFHNQSLFARHFGMGLKSKSLWAFAQNQTCKHSFGCVEHFLRKAAYNCGLYVIAKHLFELASPKEWAIGELIKSQAKDLKLEDSKLSAVSVAVQAFFILGISLYGVSRCLSAPRPKVETIQPKE